MAESIDRRMLVRAFESLGEDLASRGAFVELAVYGGSAIMLQFEWRRSTEDVDAIVRDGYDEAVLKEAANRVAARFGFAPDWLNNAVGMFTPLTETETLFEISGSYPSSSKPGLRIFLARPHYLLAMKLRALSSVERGERDMTDARALARHLGLLGTEDLCRLYESIHGEQPTAEAKLRFPGVFGPGS